MKVVKEKGQVQEYNRNKIRSAIIQSYNQIAFPDFDEIDLVVDEIEELIWATAENEEISIDKIENIVMSVLYREAPAAAREYSSYKIHRENIKKNPSEIDKVLYVSPEIDQENANKKAVLAHIKNAYLAEIPSREEFRKVFPQACVEAHDKGVVYAHDSGYSVRPMHNCLARETEFITSEGVKSFYDFKDGDEVLVLSDDGQFHKAVVHSYGQQKLYRNSFYRGKKEHTYDVLATKNHRWYLEDNKITTDLKIGDKLKSAPYLFNFELSDEEYFNLPLIYQIMWCKGFALGDGTKEYCKKDKLTGHTRIRLCGNKNKFLSRFDIDGCRIRGQVESNGDHYVIVENYQKEIPDFDTIEEIKYFFLGLYEADGRYNASTKLLQSSDKNIINFVRKYAPVVGAYITKEHDLTGETTILGKRGYTISFSMINCRPSKFNYTLLKQEFERIDEVWCLEVEDTHNFVLSNGILTGNCELLNLDYLLQHGCKINNTWVDRPHSFRVACTVATQILTHVTSNTYGGCTINLLALAKFVDVSRQSIRKKFEKYDIPDGIRDKLIEEELNEEIKQGIQTFTYQNQTLCSDVGQAVFLTISVYLNEDKEYTDDLILIFKELLRQRIEGIPNENGIYENPNFPKILYFLDEDTMRGGKYYDITKLCAECSAKRLVPDYMSVKKHLELKGVVTPSINENCA